MPSAALDKCFRPTFLSPFLAAAIHRVVPSVVVVEGGGRVAEALDVCLPIEKKTTPWVKFINHCSTCALHIGLSPISKLMILGELCACVWLSSRRSVGKFIQGGALDWEYEPSWCEDVGIWTTYIRRVQKPPSYSLEKLCLQRTMGPP